MISSDVYRILWYIILRNFLKSNMVGGFFSFLVFCSAYSGGVDTKLLEGNFDYCSAYSGFAFSMTIEGGIDFVLAYSGLVGTITIVGVSFRTGLRG